MHKYAQDIYERLMGRSQKPKSWRQTDIERFSMLCYEKANSCKCGCGEKTNPANILNRKSISLSQWFYKFSCGEFDITFADYIAGHNNRKINGTVNITGDIHQAILGSILGDGSLMFAHSKARSPRLAWNMGNKEHAKYKRDFLSDFKPSYVEKENPGFGSKWFCVCTASSIQLNEYHNKYYIGTKKNPTKEMLEELTAVGWAWLYGDDGHYDKKRKIAFIHTEAFTSDQVDMFVNAANRFLNMKACVKGAYIGGLKKRELFLVRFNKRGSDEFIKRVKPHMANGMEYKVS